MFVVGRLLFLFLSWGIAGALFWFGFLLASDRNGFASRDAARWTSWRLDIPPEEQPVRRRKTFEQNLQAKKSVGITSMVMGCLVAVLAVASLFNHR